jgi:hypothetical protein
MLNGIPNLALEIFNSAKKKLLTIRIHPIFDNFNNFFY